MGQNPRYRRRHQGGKRPFAFTQAHPAPAIPEGIWRTLDRVVKHREEADRLGQESARQAREAERLLERAEAFTNPWEQMVESRRRRDLANLLLERGTEVTAVSVFPFQFRSEKREVDVLATTKEELWRYWSGPRMSPRTWTNSSICWPLYRA